MCIRDSRDIIRKHAEIQIYEDYSEEAEDLGMTEQQFNDYKSKYLDITVGFIEPPITPSVVAEDPVPYGNNQGLEDIDFCLELLHSDIINVAYILELIAELDPYSADYAQRRQHIIDTMIKDAEMRSKAKLIDGFIPVSYTHLDTIEYVEALQGNVSSKATGFHYFQINVIKLDFYKRIVYEFSKNDQFKEILDKILKDIDSVDWTAKEKDKLGRLEDWLGKNASNQDKPKTIKDMKDLMNVYLLIEMSFADMSCVIRAFMNAGSDIEYPLTFRRLLVSKVSTLGHLVGYNDTETVSYTHLDVYKRQPYHRDYPYKEIDKEEEKRILSDYNCQVIHTSPEYQTNLDINTPTNRILTSMCSPERLLYIIRYGIAYVKMEREVDGKIESTDQKHIMRYQQMFASCLLYTSRCV